MPFPRNPKRQQSLPKPSADAMRVELREALKFAVNGEHRFGIRDDCRAELDQRWDKVVALLEQLRA